MANGTTRFTLGRLGTPDAFIYFRILTSWECGICARAAVLPLQRLGDLQGVCEFSLCVGHAAEGDVVLAVSEGALGINDGDLANGGEFVEKLVQGQLEAGGLTLRARK